MILREKEGQYEMSDGFLHAARASARNGLMWFYIELLNLVLRCLMKKPRLEAGCNIDIASHTLQVAVRKRWSADPIVGRGFRRSVRRRFWSECCQHAVANRVLEVTDHNAGVMS